MNRRSQPFPFFSLLADLLTLVAILAGLSPRLDAQTQWTAKPGCGVGLGHPGEWNAFALGTAGVIQKDGELHLFQGATPVDACAYVIGEYVSENGCDWTLKQTLTLEDTHPWNPGGFGAPDILRSEDGWLLFYQGADCQLETKAIGVARSSDFEHWEDVSASPLLLPQENWEVSTVLAPSVVRANDGYHMFYAAGPYDESPSSIRRWTIGHRTSVDGVSGWDREPRGPLFFASDVADELERPLGVYGPEVIWHEETASFEMWFSVVTEGLLTDFIAYATSLDGDTWEIGGRVDIEGESLPSVGQPSIAYDPDAGSYDMWYSVSDGSLFWQETRRATAAWTTPRASFSVERVEGEGFSLRLDASRSRGPRDEAPGDSVVSFVWDLGDDGIQQMGSSIEHTYSEGGTYRITLTVTDDSGAAGRVARVVTLREPTFTRGDSDQNGDVELTDAVVTFNWLFLGGPRPACVDAADADDTGTVELTDGVRTLNFLFLGGPPPSTPFPTCGVDPSPEEPALDCDESAGCEPGA